MTRFSPRSRLSILLLLTGLGTALLPALARADAPPRWSDLVPANAQGLVAIRLASATATPVGKKLLRGLAGKGEDLAREMQDKTGLELADVERFAVVVNDPDRMDETGWTIVSTRPDVEKKVLARLRDRQEKKHAGKTYYTGAFGAPPKEKAPAIKPSAVCFASGNLFVVTRGEEAMKDCLSFVAGKKPAGGLAEAIKQAASSKRHLFVGFVVLPAKRAELKKLLPPDQPHFQTLAEAVSGTVAADLADPMPLELSLRYATVAQAKDARRALDGLKALAGLVLLSELTPDVKNTVQSVLDTLAIERSGRDVLISTRLPARALDQMMKPAAAPKR